MERNIANVRRQSIGRLVTEGFMSSGPSVESLSQSDVSLRFLSPEAWLEGSSAAITRVRAQIHRAAPYFRTAFLTGERGSGEEAAAHMLHQLSALSQRPFLILSNAEVEKRISVDRSLNSLAPYGMLYLPQIECVSLTLQEALIRLIRKRKPQMPCLVGFDELGLNSLRRAGKLSPGMAGSFAMVIKIPSLRDRSEDIPALLSHMFRNASTQAGAPASTLDTDLLVTAMKCPWLGNLIELHSTAEGLVKQGAQDSLHSADLEAVLGPAFYEPLTMRLEDVVQRHIRTVLFNCHGDKRRAANLLGISHSSLYRMLKNDSYPAPSANVALRLEATGIS